ncbi:DUF4304 domain-containing protein [Paenibacillus sp. CGMCC 1.16610]|nr:MULTISPECIES: DUF4304 domain-containing protein [Paenibacillus]MBA2936891.1 DUF4304 domain-containing protein [Paenibacillus sp. CGMCC 1.16610]
MSVERDIMIDALKTIVIPELREKGFKGSFPHFRRITDKKIDILTFQFDKYGGGFRLEIAVCSPEGLTHDWGEKVTPNKVTAYHLNIQNRKTILDNGNWFRYDKKTFFGSVYKKVASKVLKSFKKAEEYWANAEFRQFNINSN